MKPREFWLNLENETISEKTRDEYIHVREVMQDECNIIIELIHQRSVAFDEARETRIKLDRVTRALEKAKEALGSEIPVNHKYSRLLEQIEAIERGEK